MLYNRGHLKLYNTIYNDNIILHNLYSTFQPARWGQALTGKGKTAWVLGSLFQHIQPWPVSIHLTVPCPKSHPWFSCLLPGNLLSSYNCCLVQLTVSHSHCHDLTGQGRLFEILPVVCFQLAAWVLTRTWCQINSLQGWASATGTSGWQDSLALAAWAWPSK